MTEFPLQLLAADKIIYKGPCEFVTVPLTDGEIGIMANHMNLLGAVKPGMVTMRIPDTEGFVVNQKGKIEVVVSGGLLKIENGEVQILIDSAEFPHEIDANRARRAAERAKEELLQNKGIIEYRSAEGALSRALARLNSAKRH